jgi:hypothetical protein
VAARRGRHGRPRVVVRLVGRADEAAEDPAEEAADIIHHRVERRHEDEAEHGRDQQAADHRDGHGRAELAAVAGAEGRRDHAGAHGECGHDDRAGALAAGVEDGLAPRHALARLLHREVDQHDRVLGDDAHQHEDADDHRHGDRVVGQQQGDDDAAEGQRQRHQDGQRLEHRVEQQHEHAEHHQEARAHGHGEALEHLLHDLGVAAALERDASGQVAGCAGRAKTFSSAGPISRPPPRSVPILTRRTRL